MEKVKLFITSQGIAWELFVITVAIVAFLVWLDVFVGNRVRINSTSLPGILFEVFANWYSYQKNKLKANSYHFATGKKYWVIALANKYYVVNKSQRGRINRLLKKHNHTVMNINILLNKAVYWTK